GAMFASKAWMPGPSPGMTSTKRPRRSTIDGEACYPLLNRTPVRSSRALAVDIEAMVAAAIDAREAALIGGDDLVPRLEIHTGRQDLLRDLLRQEGEGRADQGRRRPGRDLAHQHGGVDARVALLLGLARILDQLVAEQRAH